MKRILILILMIGLFFGVHGQNPISSSKVTTPLINIKPSSASPLVTDFFLYSKVNKHLYWNGGRLDTIPDLTGYAPLDSILFVYRNGRIRFKDTTQTFVSAISGYHLYTKNLNEIGFIDITSTNTTLAVRNTDLYSLSYGISSDIFGAYLFFGNSRIGFLPWYIDSTFAEKHIIGNGDNNSPLNFGHPLYPWDTIYSNVFIQKGTPIVSFPGFGTSHITAAYGDHNHSGVYQPAGSYLTGSGTSNYIPKWSSSSGLGNSQIFDNGSFIGIGTTSPLTSEKFRIDAGNGPGLVVQNASTGYGEPAFAAYSTGAGPANGIAIYASCAGSLVNYALWAEDGILYSKDGAKIGSGNKDSLFTCNGSAHYTGNIRIDGNSSVKKLNSDSAIVSGTKANGNSSTAINIYASQGNTQTVTRTGNCTYTLVGMASGQKLTLVMVHEASATAYTVAFSPSILWAGGVTPTYTNSSGAVDVVCIVYDGTRYLGMQTADFK